MSRSCVCGGSNENCRFCGGSGMLPDRLGAALDETLHRMEEVQIHAGSGKVRPKLVSHRSKGKRVTPRVPDQPRTKRTPIRQLANCVICPQGCGAQLNPRRIERHLRKVHAIRTPSPHQMKNLAPTRPTPMKLERKYESCSVCRVRVRTDRMTRHMRKVHNARQSGLRATVVSSSNNRAGKSTSLVAPIDKNLDATKLYAHSYREQGRFGSHPSHDGFDDESSPD